MANNKNKIPSVLAEAGDSRDGTAILCNDPSGLCLGHEGAPLPNPGAYTNLIQLAAQLQPEDALITIETESSAIFVKSYDGHAVAVQVPSTAGTPSSDSTTADTLAENNRPDRDTSESHA